MTFRLQTRATLWAALAVGVSAAAPSRFVQDRVRAVAERVGYVREGGGLTTSLVFAPRSFDFGSVRSGAQVQAEFEYVNESKAPIRITAVKGTCGCVNAKASTSYVEPGARGKITATVTTAGRQGGQSFRVQVTTDEGPKGGAALQIKGEIRMAMRPRPPHLLLGAVAPGSEQTAEIRIEKLEAVDEVAITCKGEGVSAEKVAEDAKSLTVRIAVKVPWKKPARGSGVTLTAGDGSLWIPVGWQILPAFEMSARAIEIKGGKGEIVAKPRWEGVTLAQVNVRSLPIEVTRDGDRVSFELKDPAFAVPRGATIEFVPEPLALGSMRVPVVVGPE